MRDVLWMWKENPQEGGSKAGGLDRLCMGDGAGEGLRSGADFSAGILMWGRDVCVVGWESGVGSE